MKKKYLILAFIFWYSTANLSGQTYTLFPNVNPSYTIEQKVEKNKLNLVNEVRIYKVNFYSRADDKLITYPNTTGENVSIALNSLKTSYYTIMVYDVEDNIIVLGLDIINPLLEKNDNELLAKENSTQIENSTQVENTFKTIKNNSGKSSNPVIAEEHITENNSDFVHNKKSKKDVPYPFTPDASYFVIKEVKKHSGSNISTFFYHNSKYVKNAIRKNKVDMKSFSGKNNRITIYEIYDLREFSKIKPKLIEAYKTSKQFTLNEKGEKVFNIIPIYQSNTENILASNVK